MPFRLSARDASFHTKHASNANVVRSLDTNSYLAYSFIESGTVNENSDGSGDRVPHAVGSGALIHAGQQPVFRAELDPRSVLQ
jgi:hypothetical protein